MAVEAWQRLDMVRAGRDAALTALVSCGLLLPLIGFNTVQNIHNELILETRWPLLGAMVAIIAGARFAHSLLIAPWLARRAVRPRREGEASWVRYLTSAMIPFTLGFAELANAAKLAPIVGAFVAGVSLARSPAADRIRRELTPVGHLFVPVFFLQIGIDAQIDAFTSTAVLRDAAVLLAVAVVGKLVSPIGAIGSPGDKFLIGLGMLPRGEVGLIFATIGLQAGVLDADLYAALLLVVLATTLVTPQLLKWRYSRLRSSATASAALPNAPAPSGEWLRVALDAAVSAAQAPPAPELVDWLTAVSSTPVNWDHGQDVVIVPAISDEAAKDKVLLFSLHARPLLCMNAGSSCASCHLGPRRLYTR